LAEADSFAVQKEAALKKKAEDLRRRLEDIFDNVDPNQFLEALSVADQTLHRPKVEPAEFDHPRYYWIFKNMDYDQWAAQDSEVLLLSGPTSCTLDHVSSHIQGLMEEGWFGKDRIVLNFFSPDGALKGNKGRSRRQGPETTVTIFAHTLLHQFISSTTISKEARISAVSHFLRFLLGSIENLELLDLFEGIGGDDTLAVIREVFDIPDRTLCDALGKILEGEKDLGIVVHVSDNMREQESDFITAVSTFIGRLSERTPGIKVLLACRPVDDSGMSLRPPHCISIQYDKERKGSFSLFLNAMVSNAANKCRVP
jgi:hypothetical protein